MKVNFLRKKDVDPYKIAGVCIKSKIGLSISLVFEGHIAFRKFAKGRKL